MAAEKIEFRCCVRGLAWETDNKSLKEAFKNCGVVRSAKVITDPNGQSKGYGFVSFATEEGMRRAIDENNGMELDGRYINVKKAMPQGNRNKGGAGNGGRGEGAGHGRKAAYECYVGGLSLATDEQSLHNTFNDFGKILYLKVIQRHSQDYGFGFVRFSTEEEMWAAIKGKNGQVLHDRTITVRESQSRGYGTDGGAANGGRREARVSYASQRVEDAYTCFVRGLAWETNEQSLKDAFSKFGEVLKSKIPREYDHETGKSYSKGYGFVTYASEEEMMEAIKGMHEQNFDGRIITVKQANSKGNKIDDNYNNGGRHQAEVGYDCYVGGLSWKTDDESLKKSFSKFGEILKTSVKYDYDGNHRGFGFVTFACEKDMLAAIEGRNGKKLNGRKIRVNEAESK